jgi:uncharacterized membrane protein YeiH
MINSTDIHLVGILFFSMSGTILGVKTRLDLFGISFVACVGALGGGTLRDILIGHYPLCWVEDPKYIIAVLIGVASSLLFRNRLAAIKNLIFVLDSIGIGFFMTSGVNICIDAGINPFISLVFGVLSVIVGGLLRDIICNEVPIILKRELVATASFAGGLMMLAGQFLGLYPIMCNILGVVTVITIRLLGSKYNWKIPEVGLNDAK